MRYNKYDKCFKNEWLTFYPKFGSFYFMYNVAGYFDRRPYVHCSVSQILAIVLLPVIGFHWYSLLLLVPFVVYWGDLYIKLPIQTKYDVCEPPRYGIYYHSSGIWICRGRKIKCIHMPYSYDWVRTSTLLKDGTWDHETKKNRRGLFSSVPPITQPIWTEEYPYTYVLKSGKVQHRIATLKVEEREWRQKWLMWTKLFAKKRKTIDIQFSYGGPIQREVLFEKNINKPVNEEHTGEVGERTGTYKGGTTGCGYNMIGNETPLDTLRRMEKERKF